MKFSATPLPGTHVIEIEPHRDPRGTFARIFCKETFAAAGVEFQVVQASISQNPLAGTLRGLHFQLPPSREGKLVRCERGRVYDVIVDLRPESRAYTRHFAVELDSKRRNALYVPPGCAHGFQALEPDSEILYMMSDYYRPDLADGVRFDDPAFDISWPLPVACISERDGGYPDFDPARHAERMRRAWAGLADGGHGAEPGDLR